VQLSGRAAAMGQGVIKDVSARIVDQFAENLAAMLGGEPAAGGAAAGGAAAAEAQVQRAEPASAAQGVGQQPAPSAPPAAPPPAAGQTDEGLDVLPIVGSIAKERLRDPRVIGGLVLLLLLFLRRRR
jgi:hypothetical protein